jgi:predicted sugar kinase
MLRYVTHFLSSRHPCKSFVKAKKILLTRASEERARVVPARTRSSHVCLLAMVPAFAEPDIHSLSQILADRHRRLSVCSLPVLKQFGESLGSLISVAQSATAGPGSLRAV